MVHYDVQQKKINNLSQEQIRSISTTLEINEKNMNE